LRKIRVNGYETRFNISTASELMAILCLAHDEDDLRKRIGNILVGYTYDKEEVLAKDLKCVNALMILLKKAINPNIVQTLEGNLALIHGGPFANIAHGTNSVISTNWGLNNFDYTVFEAGFGSDMGGVKFFDIITRNNKKLIPDVVVLNTTIQSLLYNGNGRLDQGIFNLDYHIDNMLKYTDNLVVVLNKHEKDKIEDINFIKEYVEDRNILFSVSEGYIKGSEGSFDLAEKVVGLSNKGKKAFKYSYDDFDSLEDKINQFCIKNYGAKEVILTDEVKKKFLLIEKSKFKALPICVAKTQYSITDNSKDLGYPKDFIMHVLDIRIFSGAGFITIYFGNILTMPGLSSDANYLHM